MASDQLVGTGRFITSGPGFLSFSVPDGPGVLQVEINEQAAAGGITLEDSYDGGANYSGILVRDMAGSFFLSFTAQGVYQSAHGLGLKKPRFNIQATGDFTIIWSFAPTPAHV